MKLHSVKKPDRKVMRTWCGPGALALITGRTVKFCATKLAEQANVVRKWTRGRHTFRSIKGVYNQEMTGALHAMGFEAVPLKILPETGEVPTLAAYMREQNTEQFRGVVLLQVTTHYLVAHRGIVADNSNLEGKPWADWKKYRRARLGSAYLIRRKKR